MIYMVVGGKELKYVWQFEKFLKVARMEVCGFLLGCMAQCVGGIENVSGRSLGQLGGYEVILGVSEVISM